MPTPKWSGWLFALALAGATSGAAAADLLIVHAQVWQQPEADAILIRDGRIAAVGRRATIAPQDVPERMLVDAAGGLVLPGFHDAHIHMLSGGMGLARLDLSSRMTLDDALAALAEYARQHPGNDWLLGRGWQYGIVPRGKFPTRHDLDRVVRDRPVVLTSYDGHSTWANSRALELAGITATTPDPRDGKIVREDDGKTPAGALLEGADELVRRVVPRPDRAAVLAALDGALRHCASLGITTVQDLADRGEIFGLYDELRREGRLPIRVIVCLPIDGDLEKYVELRRKYDGPDLRFGFLKGFVDGVVESHTAYMLAPYVGSAERGKPLLGYERMRELVTQARERGFVVGVHAVGDGAVRLALDAFSSSTAEATQAPMGGRIEHIEVLDPADAARFKSARVIASMMPFHAGPDLPKPNESPWAAPLGADRLRHSFPWRELTDAGATLAFGSDWPVMTADPLQGIAMAITRRNAKGEPPGGWNAHQCLTPEEAVRAYTEGSARSVGLEKELGRLAPGYRADLVVLKPGVDPRRTETLWAGPRIARVLVDGKIQFSAPAAAPGSNDRSPAGQQ